MRVPIKLAAQHSGLTPQRIRMWEKRYGILAGVRSASNRRQFSEEEVEHLSLLHAATKSGHRIGDIARLTLVELRRLVETTSTPTSTMSVSLAGSGDALGQALRAIIGLDEKALRKVIAQAHRERGHQGLLQAFVAPLLELIGEQWVAGNLRTLHEHFATATLRTVLLEDARVYAPESDAPTLISTTPRGQLHEMGAVLTAAAAKNQGWKVLYLGANMPAVEIAAAARQARAVLVALSVIHPVDDPQLPAELHVLREDLPTGTQILAGGRALAHYAATLDRIGARTANSLSDLIDHLQQVRRGDA